MLVFGKKKNNLPASQKAFPEDIDQKPSENLLGIAATQKKELEKRYRWLQHKNRLEKTATSIYDRREREKREEIKAIREEIIKLAQAVDKLDHLTGEIDQATKQPTIKPSLYELSFWQRLRQMLNTIIKDVEKSSLWFQESNRKRKKKNFWGMVDSKKGGAQVLLSSEHYVSRSTG